jgi:hypothetical protein
MPASDRDVYQHFHARKDGREVNALAYAGYAKAKYEWFAHVEARTGRQPSPEEVDRWIADLPDSRLEQLRQEATDLLDLAARAYMAADIEKAVAAARDDAIIREVRASNEALSARLQTATAFGTTFFANLFIGVVASFAFSLLVIAASLIFARDPSPFALYRSLQPAATQSPTQTPPKASTKPDGG